MGSDVYIYKAGRKYIIKYHSNIDRIIIVKKKDVIDYGLTLGEFCSEDFEKLSEIKLREGEMKEIKKVNFTFARKKGKRR